MSNIGMVFFRTLSRPASAAYRVYPQVQTEAVLLEFNPAENNPEPNLSNGRMDRRRRMIPLLLTRMR